MEKDKKFHKSDQFNQFDWSKLIYSKHSGGGENFSFGKGGNHYIGGTGWHISMYNEDGVQESEWQLPKALSDMIDLQSKWGKEENQKEVKRAFRNILGIE